MFLNLFCCVITKKPHDSQSRTTATPHHPKPTETITKTNHTATSTIDSYSQSGSLEHSSTLSLRTDSATSHSLLAKVSDTSHPIFADES